MIKLQYFSILQLLGQMTSMGVKELRNGSFVP